MAISTMAPPPSTLGLIQVILTATLIHCATTQQTTGCPSGFSQSGNYCFHQFDSYISKSEATAYCSSRSASLPYPVGGLEEWQAAITQANIGIFRWAGASPLGDLDGTWAWSDRTPVQRGAWGSVDPTGSDIARAIPVGDDCSAVNHDGTIGFSSCLPALPVLCQRYLSVFPASYIQRDMLENSRGDTSYPPSTEAERRAALAYVRQLNTSHGASQLSQQTQYFQGDILVQSEEELFSLLPETRSSERHHLVRRAAARLGRRNDDVRLNAGESYGTTWPNGVIPYCISTKFSQEERNIILGAIEDINDKISCLNFRDRGSCENKMDKKAGEYYLNIVNTKGGCNSYVGSLEGIEQAGQEVQLPGSQCLINDGQGYITTALHELIHAAGFHHEFSRRDRDDYITVIEENLFNKDSYKKLNNVELLPLPYDFESVMHYEYNAGGIPDPETGKAKRTMRAKKPGQELPGPVVGMKPYDELALRLLYGCENDGLPELREAEGCTDIDDHLCEYWASNDGCTNWPQYRGCTKSCNKCPTTTTTTTTTTPAPTPRGECDWPSGEHYRPHPTDCHKFIQCTPSGPVEKSCALRTKWEQDKPICNFDNNGTCD